MIYTIITFLVGIIFLIVRYGLQDSISQYYYVIPNNYNFMWSIWISMIGILLLNQSNTILLDLSGCCLIGVGCCEQYKSNKYVHFFHFFFAYGSIIFGLLNMLSILIPFCIISSLIIGLSLLNKSKYQTFITEIISFILIISSLFIK